ncbi:LysM peptidoglycan-binding domain-containing protein [Ligilactobacillus saerimneri]|uniref:aggregation-promoting factor n=1 Tax=Ligilactobacillus saerimneri TaxID=228229 RepID=UPI00040ABB6A|nr:LysM peptidoglycan-binding domain-containing protein [Ligilactobacillus saerimneri]KRL72234.1 extracellular surface protein [Ligilactobacillus saerimneri DSM 16049]
MAMKKVLMSVAAAGGMFVVGTSTAHADNVTYTVKAGDTVSEIAEHFDTTVAKIKQLNQLENENLILVGQKLLVTGEQPVNTTNGTANNTSANTGNTNQAAYQAPVTQAPSTATGSDAEAKAWIASHESGGSYTASNGNYYGKYQLSRSYLGGDYSPANQECVADNYVASRYGSWSAAKSHWLSHGWY